MMKKAASACAAAVLAGLLWHPALSSEPSAQHSKPGFVTYVADGRLWVFRDGSKEHDEFKKHGELGKMVARIGAGPNGMTIRSGDAETIEAYLAAK